MTDAIAKKQESALGIPSKDFLKEYSPIAVPAKTAAIRSPVEAAASNMPTLSQIKKHFGEKMTVFYLTTWLDNLTAYLGKKYELSEPQTVETATLILQRYPHLNIADLKMVFDSIKTGDCGVTLYGDINGLTIVKIFDAYSETRSRLCYEKNLQRDDVIKKHGYDKCTILSENDVYVGYEELRQRKEREAQKENEEKNAHCIWLKSRIKEYCEKHRVKE